MLEKLTYKKLIIIASSVLIILLSFSIILSLTKFKAFETSLPGTAVTASLKTWVIGSTILILIVFLFLLFCIWGMIKEISVNGINENIALKDYMAMLDIEVEKINQMYIEKIEFFSNISHDLKTPLSVILGAIQLLEQKQLYTKQTQGNFNLSDDINLQKNHKIIRQNCYRLLKLVNNILDFTRIETGYIKLSLTNCNLVNLVEEITQSISPYVEQKNIKLLFDTNCEEVIAAVDIGKIERVLLNLLSNAIKFTPSFGTIQVTFQSKESSAVISVKDTGLGIPASMHSEIFKRFKQANSKHLKKIEGSGSGIGLSLVKSFVELHNGKINLKSKENEGSEFIIELPITIAEDTGYEEVSSIGQSSRIDTIKIEFSDIYTTAC